MCPAHPKLKSEAQVRDTSRDAIITRRQQCETDEIQAQNLREARDLLIRDLLQERNAGIYGTILL